MLRQFNKYKENIFSVLLVLTVFSGLFCTKLIPIFIATLFLVWIVKFKSFQNFSLKLKWIWPFLFYFFVFAIALFFSEDTNEGLKILERHISFIVLPFLIYCKRWSKSELDFFGKFYVRIVVLISFFSLASLLYFYLTHIDFVRAMDSTYLQWKLPHLLGFHPTYFGLIIVVANIILLTSLNKSNPIFNKSIFYSALFLSFYLVYLSPRTPIFCLLIVWTWFVHSRITNNRSIKINRKVLFIGTILLLVFLTYTSEYFMNKLVNSSSDKRFLLWEPAFDLIKENYFLLGEGLGNGKIQIANYISENNLTQFKVTDLHNQFLMNYLDTGIFGFLAILLILFRPLIYLKDKALSLFSITFSISILTESYLFVIKGILLFIIMLSFFILKTSLPSWERNKKINL